MKLYINDNRERFPMEEGIVPFKLLLPKYLLNELINKINRIG